MNKGARWALVLCLMAVLTAGAGCSYTVVTSDVELPAPGPKVAAGLSAAMPQVEDVRSWPETQGTAPIPQVRIFAPRITDSLRQGLISSGLFKALPAPDTAPASLDHRLVITVNQFQMAKTGNNAWLVPHLVLDAAVLPAFTAVAFVSQGQVDMGGYVVPSTKLSTTLAATVAYRRDGQDVPVLERAYKVAVPLGAISERRLFQHWAESSSYGVDVGKAQGEKALALLADTISRDPRWALLPQYAVLARGNQLAAKDTAEARVMAAGSTLSLLGEPKYLPEVAKVLRDPYLDPGVRASIAHDIRERRLGSDMAGKPISAAQAAELYNDPALERSLVRAELYNQVLQLLARAMTPIDPKKPAAQVVTGAAPAGPPLPERSALRPGAPPRLAQTPPATAAPAGEAAAAPAKAPGLSAQKVAELQDGLIAEAAGAFKNRPRLQVLLLQKADQSVEAAWPKMERLLKLIDSPLIRRYLAQRGA